MSTPRVENRSVSVEQLEVAMAAFNTASRELAGSYRDLEDRTASLVGELAEANNERIKELKAKEKLATRLRLLLDALPGGVVVLDENGCVSECNPAAAKLLDATLLGCSWLQIVESVFAPRPDDGHEVSLKNGRRVNVSTCSLGDEPGQILLIKDVTETRRLQERVSRMERLSSMGKMVASLAHQIRTPLATALLLASNLSGSKGRYQQLGERISERLRKLESLVENMLCFANRGHLDITNVSIKELLEEFNAVAMGVLVGRRAQLAITAEDDVLTKEVAVNSRALTSAMSNLVNNSLEHGHEELEIGLVVKAVSEGMCRFQFTDDGPGIPRENADRIFEPFFSTRSAGTGLGLAVVRSIAQAHKGSVRFRPNPSGGVIFDLDIPLTHTSPS